PIQMTSKNTYKSIKGLNLSTNYMDFSIDQLLF
ncbi:MAG: hypothetical protein ACI81W_000902, partial [Saprospiraceae bacterium]